MDEFHILMPGPKSWFKFIFMLLLAFRQQKVNIFSQDPY